MQEGKEKREEKPVNAEQILRTLAERWRGAVTLEYRSQLVLSHQGEAGLRGELTVRLRRPNLARIDIRVDNPEACGLRVCDGRVIWQRNQRVPLRPARTQRHGFQTTVMAGIAHPLDEAAYSVDQFLAPQPFRLTGSGVERSATQRKDKERDVFVVVQTQTTSRDTLTLDAKTYAPLRLVRVGDHGGVVQELLREEFHDVILGSALPTTLFRWTPEDEARQ
ncbi:outer membrane lipoprotein carrier protein LolA [Armatimonas sp.]|uniref:LolA family protein n=1 Tax=Armatimonas sp. TaxID=1872638 RepID=UPI0037526714